MATLSESQLLYILRHKTSAVVLAGGKGSRLDPLTRERAKPAVPFGGVYRIIDFVLSNCLNSNLRKIHVLTQYKGMSLDRHVNNGWRRYFCQELGEFIDVVPPQQRIVDNWYQGSADAVYQNIYEIEKEKPEYVVILAGDHVYKMDYRLMIRQHIESGADVTVAAKAVPCEQAAGSFGVMEIAGDRSEKMQATNGSDYWQARGCEAARAEGQGYVSEQAGFGATHVQAGTDLVGADWERRLAVGFEEKPAVPQPMPGRPGFCLASMGIYVFTARFLFEKLCQDANRLESRRDFGLDVIPEAIERNRVFAYLFSDQSGADGGESQNQSFGQRPYWRDVGTISSYYEANMDLIAIEPELNLYDPAWQIRSYNPDLPPAKFVFCESDRQGQAINSVVGCEAARAEGRGYASEKNCFGVTHVQSGTDLVGQGSVISGGQVNHSVLGRSVRVNSYATVEDSILFDDVVIGRGARIRRCIIDRGVVIPTGLRAGFDADEDRRRGFHVTPEGIVVIIRNS